MADLTQGFAPPAYWQAFEDLTVGAAAVLFGDPSPQKVGRAGQAQEGLDVHARARDGLRIGIQCKRRDDRDANGDVLAGGPVTIATVRSALKAADDGAFTVDLFILATTAKPDTALKAAVERLRSTRRSKGKGDVLVWSWADYEAALNRHAALQADYYRSVPQGLTDPERDAHLLGAFAEAFERPALRDPLNCEHPDDFKTALSDLRMALATGQVRTREGRLLRQAAGGLRTLADPKARQGMDAVMDELDRFREDLLTAERQGLVSQQAKWFLFHDPDVQRRLEQRRRAVVAAMNTVLTGAGLHPLPVR